MRCNNTVSYEFIWIRTTCDYIQLNKYYYGWRRGSVVRTSVFNWRIFPDLRLIYGWHVTTSWVRCPLWVCQQGQLTLPSLRMCTCLAVRLARVCGLSLQPIGCTSALACDEQRYGSCSCRLPLLALYNVMTLYYVLFSSEMRVGIWARGWLVVMHTYSYYFPLSLSLPHCSWHNAAR